MDPLPLKAPDGRIYAYICKNCRTVNAGASRMGKKDGPDEVCVNMAKEQAEKCCRCFECKTPLFDKKFMQLRCDECEKAEEVKIEIHSKEWQEKDAKRDKALNKVLDKCGGDKDAVASLRDLMSTISESNYCAGWLYELEYTLWGIMIGEQDREFGFREIPQYQIAELKRLSGLAKGWCFWSDKYEGNMLVPLDEWKEMYRSYITNHVAEDDGEDDSEEWFVEPSN